jgi:anti-sigma28 factor (negative regulator of flagellin synthesis)
MSQISLNTQSLTRPDQLSRSIADQVARRSADAASSRAADRVEVSEAARQAAQDSAPVRLNLVQRVREQIANGTYETPDKVAIASHELTRALKNQH